MSKSTSEEFLEYLKNIDPQIYEAVKGPEMSLFKKWVTTPAKWYQIWMLQSGFIGFALRVLVVVFSYYLGQFIALS